MRSFVFVVHNHQPIGNFDHVIREAFEKSYKPFIDLVYWLKYPKICFHFSGILYDWIFKNEPRYLDKLREMVQREQIEILSGGYYEPVLGVIPYRDAVSQVKKLNEYIIKNFGFYPKGSWLTERVFTPSVVGVLNESGIEYSLVDDTHFFTSAIEESEVNDCFITEYEGRSLKLFAINHNLRYLIPYKEPYKTLEYINSFKDGIFVMADDGEKFGLWPKSYKLVYEEKWLYNFFETIKSSDLEMVRFVDILNRKKSSKLVYLPNTSYFELTQWALLADDSNKIENLREKTKPDLRKFIRGGSFENFFTKYRESNLINKRSRFVSELVRKNYNCLAESFLHMAQCNCGWWHGVFGGLYLSHIRMAIYENLLKAQKIIFDNSQKNLDFKIFDIDCDSIEDIIVETKNNFFIISPVYGGSITEFSSKNKSINYSAVVDRKKEAYHQKPVKDINGNNISNNSNSYNYDWHHRAFLLDHFVSPGTKLEDFYNVRYGENGDFIPQAYSYQSEISDGSAEISLNRNGVVWDGDKKMDVSVSKKIVISKERDGFSGFYKIKNLSNDGLKAIFMPELVFAFSNISVANLKEVDNIASYIFNDSVRGNIKLDFSIPLKLWIFPIETISNSENGIEKNYQGSVVCPRIERCFQGLEEFSFSFSVAVL